jgi:hypothetical protein
MNDMKTRLAVVGRVLTAVVFLIAILGLFSNSYAKSKKFGKLQYNPEVIPRFASTEPMPKNMDIYFSGPADRPFAMIGIIKGNIGKWRQMIHDYNDMLANPYFGYDMLDPDGKVFGKWISYERRTTIKMTRDNKLTVYTPDGPIRLDDDPQRIGR